MSSIKLKRPSDTVNTKPQNGITPNRSLAEQLQAPAESKKPKGTELARMVRIDTMLDMALSILDDQIIKFHLRFKTMTVDEREVKILESLISTVAKVSKEQRERDKADDFSDLTDDELLALFQDLMNKRGIK